MDDSNACNDDESAALALVAKEGPELKLITTSEHNQTEESSRKRLRCSLTGHEIPPTTHAVREYLQSHKFIQARAVDKLTKDFKPYLVKATPEKLEEVEKERESKKSSNKSKNKNESKASTKTPRLWCTLTNSVIRATEEAAMAHMLGKKFTKALDNYEAERLGKSPSASASSGPDKTSEPIKQTEKKDKKKNKSKNKNKEDENSRFENEEKKRKRKAPKTPSVESKRIARERMT